MADKKENELTSKSDFAYVRALDSAGNSIRISKADLVSVVEGLMQSRKDEVRIAYYDSNNNLATADWTSSVSNPIGVAVIDGGRRLIVALDQQVSKKWGSASGSGGAVTTTNRDTADQDFDGKENTSKIMSSSTYKNDSTDYAVSYCHSYAKGNHGAGKWWLPSLGELGIIFKYFEPINNALAKIGGTPLDRATYWSSTEYSTSNAWYLIMHNGYRGYNSKTSSQYRVRPVSAF